jgi:hypothetical protein
VGSLAGSVGSQAGLLAPNVGSCALLVMLLRANVLN